MCLLKGDIIYAGRPGYTGYVMTLLVFRVMRLAGKMVKYGLARNRLHALTLIAGEGLAAAEKEVAFWERAYRGAEELARSGARLRHGGLRRLLEIDRSC